MRRKARATPKGTTNLTAISKLLSSTAKLAWDEEMPLLLRAIYRGDNKATCAWTLHVSLITYRQTGQSFNTQLMH
jgi:hypothetical protein